MAATGGVGVNGNNTGDDYGASKGNVDGSKRSLIAGED